MSIFDCLEDDDDCEDDGPFTQGSGLGQQEETLGHLLAQLLPWIIGTVSLLALMGSFGWFFWRRYLTPSPDPETTFRHLAFLGSLNSVGPISHQTPYQYLSRLSEAFPSHQGSVSQIINTYVRSQYGKKDLSNEERQGLVQAWLRVRLPLLFHILRRRNGEQS